MEVVAHGLHPVVPGLDGEVAPLAHGLEHLPPVIFTVRVAILQVELVTADWLLTLVADEADRVVGLLQSVNTLPNNWFPHLVQVGAKYCS